MPPSRSSVVALALALGCGAPRARMRPLCPTGRVVLAGQDDVTDFAHCTTAASIVIRTGMPLDLSGLALDTVEGDLVIGPSFQLAEVNLPLLARVGGTLQIASNANLGGAYLPALASVRRLVVAGNATLGTVSLPRLAAVAEDASFEDNAAVELVNLSSLTRVGGALTVVNAPQLTLLEAEALQAAGSVRLDGLPMLPPDVAERVRSTASTP